MKVRLSSIKPFSHASLHLTVSIRIPNSAPVVENPSSRYSRRTLHTFPPRSSAGAGYLLAAKKDEETQ